MAKSETNRVLCHFRVKPGKEDAFLEVCREHESVLRALGLATDEPTTIDRGWFPTGSGSAGSFDTAEEALREACAAISWLRAVIHPDRHSPC